MKNLRRIISLVMAFTILMSLCACDVKNDNEQTNPAIPATDTYEYDETLSDYEDDYIDDTDNENPASMPQNIKPNTSNNKPQSNSQASEPENLTPEEGREIVRVTIPEGYTLTQIFKKLEANGVCSFNELMNTAQSYDYSYYPLIAQRPNRTYAFKLEGYLFPSTYEFYKDEKPQDAIGRFLRKGKTIFDSSDEAKARALGFSIHDILTVASIIEKEGSNSAQVRKIAGVIYNRLEKGMKLQMDSGIVYIEKRVKPFISGDINRYNSLYNMYKCAGLPNGPICNPGLTTINAALNPDRSGGYLFFCHDSNANYYYAATYEEHLANLEKAGLA